MRRIAIVTTIALLLALVGAPVTDAGRLWCRVDPIVTIDDRVVDISLAIPLQYLWLVNGPTVIEITVPAGVDRQLVLNDVGFGHGSIVTFRDGGTVQDNQIPVTITASVSIDRSRLAPGSSVPLQLMVVVETLEAITLEVMRQRARLTGP